MENTNEERLEMREEETKVQEDNQTGVTSIEAIVIEVETLCQELQQDLHNLRREYQRCEGALLGLQQLMTRLTGTANKTAPADSTTK